MTVMTPDEVDALRSDASEAAVTSQQQSQQPRVLLPHLKVRRCRLNTSG